MKRLKCILYLLALCVFFCNVSPLTAFATETSTEIDYITLFSASETVNLDSSNDYSASLNSAFSIDPTSFLDALSTFDKDIVQSVTWYWTSGKTLADLKSLHTNVCQNPNKENYTDIINALEQHINVQEYALNIESLAESMPLNDYAFDVPVIQNLISLHLNSEINSEEYNHILSTDEEFNHVLTSAYEASPSLFAETIKTYSQLQIEDLAECIASDYVKMGKELSSVPYSTTDISCNDITNLIQEKIASKINVQLEAEASTVSPPTVEPMSLCIPTIGTMTYSSAPLQVGTSETLKITFSESSQISSLRQWYVEIYQVVGSTYYKKVANTITFTPGTTSSTVSFTMTFSSPCEFYTFVKVYSAEGGTLLNSRQGAYSDTVTGLWHINVDFSDDRSEPGTLYLYNASGTKLFQTSCLGKSASNLPQSQTNGDTPTGTYTGRLSGPDYPTESYGPYKVVAMTGVSGNIALYSHRSGIGIHGGRSQETLQATNGCIRVFNSAQLTLQNTITSLINDSYHETIGYVYVNDPDSSN